MYYSAKHLLRNILEKILLFYSRQLILQIGHFRVPLGLCIKRRLSAQPLIWKWLFILVQIKLMFARKVVHLVLKVGVFGTWKWPIDIRGQLYLYVIIHKSWWILSSQTQGRRWGFFPKTCLLSHEKKLMFLGE